MENDEPVKDQIVYIDGKTKAKIIKDSDGIKVLVELLETDGVRSKGTQMNMARFRLKEHTTMI